MKKSIILLCLLSACAPTNKDREMFEACVVRAQKLKYPNISEIYFSSVSNYELVGNFKKVTGKVKINGVFKSITCHLKLYDIDQKEIDDKYQFNKITVGDETI